VVEELTMELVPVLKGRARVRVHAPIALDDVSEPEPDIAIVAEGRPRGGHPTTAIALIEVAETFVRRDLGEKAEAYARAAIPEYWVVNIPAQCIVVHLEPADGRYRRITTYGRGEAIRLQAFPDVEVRVDSIP
jgi:Uma2 family endonuclease